MFSPKTDKNVLFVGVKSEEFDPNFCVMNTETHSGKQIFIIDLATENNSPEKIDIFDKLNHYEIQIKNIDAVIFYNMENNLKTEFISKLDPQCLCIDFYKANMTKMELFDKIVTFDKRSLLDTDFYKNNILLLSSIQDRDTTIGQLPKDLVHHIMSYYSDLHYKDNDSFRFFKSIHKPLHIPDTFSQIVEQKANEIVENCTVM